jgi:pimeloyl-ACP methyl ester carboxylesterase
MFKPTIVLVPGCWYPVATFDKLVAALESRGYKAVVVALPSSTSNSPDATFLDDITAVRTAIEAETSAGRDVVVAAHSYGGLPAHSGSKGLTVGSPEPTSTGGKVIGFVLMASGFTMTGMCFLDPTGGVPPPQWKANKETGFAELLVDPVDMFFHDLPAEEGKMWASKLGKQSLKALAEGGEHAYSSWTEAPNYYIVTKQDHGLPASMQQMIIGMAASADVTVRELDASHSPMLSMPEETANIIDEAATEFEGKRAK